MKDQYFGDINDYRNYGLLRLLCGPGAAASRQNAAVLPKQKVRRPTESPLRSTGSLSLGIAWMLTAPDGRRDGQRIAYLNQPERYRRFDPPLFDALRDIVLHHRRRRILCAEEFGLFPGARFFNDEFTDDPHQREALLPRLLDQFAGCDVIFFDPDNGLEVKSRPWGRKDSCKYLYWREVEATFQRGHSVLIFQHFPRVDRRSYTRVAKRQLLRRTGAAAVIAFKTSLVVFLLAVQPVHAARLRERAALVQAGWRGQVNVM
jgi:hypothetical protein